MNVFYLDQNPWTAARYHCDKHVTKMILEYGQLLSTAHRMLDGRKYYELTKNGRRIARWKLKDPKMEAGLYKASHINHPSAVWTRSHENNYYWVYEAFKGVLKEYDFRYRGYDKYESARELVSLLVERPKNMPNVGFTPPPQCMPDEYKCDSAVEAYRNYYKGAKAGFASWKNTKTPTWWYTEAEDYARVY